MSPVLVCAAGLAGCLLAEHRGSQRGLWLAKPIASAAFLWAAFSWGATASSFGAWLAAGLVACALGDVLLIAKGAPRAMHAGMLAFGIGHLLFTAGFVVHGLVPAAALTAGAVTFVLMSGVWRWLRPHLGLEDRRAVLAYLIVITAMLSCALGAAAGGAPAQRSRGPCCSRSRTSRWHEIASSRPALRAPCGDCLRTTPRSCCWPRAR